MNLFHRISVCFVVCCSVACSKSDADLPVPAAEPETVVIGCATAGADMEVRTQIDDDLSVRWVSGDEIRLWAREHGAADFLSEVRNTPFRFDYYSPQWSRAGFTGTISGLASAFDTERSYDYFAVSPAPASDSDVAGTSVAYDIPSVQTGKFDGRYDILTAQLENAAALKKGDNNPSINLKFRHHVHVMKFTVPQNALGEKIRVVELTFPQPVVGRMTVDATGAAADDLSGIDCDKVSVEFSKGEELDAGDTFFVTIAPATFDAGTQIGMRIIGTTGETSVDYTFPLPKVCKAEHLTPVELHVPAKNTFYTVVKFKIADNDRPECAGKENLFGVNTLGERVHTVRLVGQTGAFANAVRMSNGCSASADGSVLTCAIPDDAAFDGTYELMFVSRKDAGSKCPWDAWDSSALSGKTLEVEYESERALIKSQEGWKPVQAAAPAIRDGEINRLSALSVPYLFEEDFNNTSETGEYHYNDDNKISATSGGDNKGIKLEDYGFPQGWTGARCGISCNQSVRICCRSEKAAGVPGTYNGRLDSPCMAALRYDDEDHEVDLKLSFDYSMNRKSSKGTKNQHYLAVGYHTTEGPINAESGVGSWFSDPLLGYKITANIQSDIYTDNFEGDWSVVNIPYTTTTNIEIKGRRSTRFVWEVYIKEKSPDGYYNNWVYLDNVRVSIAH